jgi:hypothetical protein
MKANERSPSVRVHLKFLRSAFERVKVCEIDHTNLLENIFSCHHWNQEKCGLKIV